MKIIRVFPRRTSMTPDDAYVFIGDPPMELWRPEADEVHISCSFTWDKDKALRLAEAWQQYYHVRLSGPAIGSQTNGFIPGLYIKHGVTFTSRGCNNNCPWCLVPYWEGNLKEIESFSLGYIIQDNNLLQCSPGHIENVFSMLRSQRRAAVFSGGLDARLIDDWIVDRLGSIRIKQLFLAADTKASLRSLRNAVDELKPLDLGRDKLRCYVLIGRDESVSEAYDRLSAVWDIGCLPFSQLFQPPDKWIEYSSEWKSLNRAYSRPAATKAVNRNRSV